MGTHPWRRPFANEGMTTTDMARRSRAAEASTARCGFCDAVAIYRVDGQGYCRFHRLAAQDARDRLQAARRVQPETILRREE